MKTNAFWPSFWGLTTVGVLCISGCKKNERPAAEPEKPASGVAAAKGSFEAVTAHLDTGGDLYMYVGTEQCLKGISGKIAGGSQLVEAIPGMKGADRANLQKLVGAVTNLFFASGIDEVRGFGLSSVPREGGLLHSKAMLYHAKGAGKGVLWSLFGREPHTLAGLDFLPANTAMATFSDMDVSLLWTEIKKLVAQSELPQAEEMLNKLPQGFEKATGLPFEKFLSSLGGEFGFAITLDETKSVSIPLPGDERLEIPEPAFIIVTKVKDDTLFNRIDQLLEKTGQQIFKADKPNLKMRTLPVPLPLPIQLGFTVAMSEGYLFIATTDALVQQALAVKAGQKAGLKSTEEFKRLARDIPQQGNAFTFVSQRFSQTLARIERRAMQMTGSAGATQTKWLQSLLGGGGGEPAFYYAVSANTTEGWVIAANGNQPPTRFLLASTAVPLGLAAGVAIPRMVKARQSGAGAQREGAKP